MRRAALVVLFAVAPAIASAHAIGVSRGTYRMTADSVVAEIVLARPEAVLAVPQLDRDGDGRVSAAELSAAHEALAATLVAGIDLPTCTGRLERAALTEEDGLALTLVYACPRSHTARTVRLALLGQLSSGHRHLASVIDGNGGSVESVVFESRPEIVLGASPSADGLGAFVVLGVEHILTGYDHLLFVLALVLAGTALRPLLLALTAFTVAHSITLALAALGVLAPSPRVVEPAIALSIAWVGFQNWRGGRGDHRWRLTCAFGLVHGFGFAGALQEIALPAAAVPRALLGFNVGVETGQIAVLAVVLPLLLWMRRTERLADRGVRGLSAAIAAVGLAWFVERLAY